MHFCLVVLLAFLWSSSLSARDAWQTTQLIWNCGLVPLCDHGPQCSPSVFCRQNKHLFRTAWYQDIQAGDLVWIQCRDLPRFVHEVLPSVSSSFVLVIGDGDDSFPSDLRGFNVEAFLTDDRVIHVFAQNNDYQGPSSKVSHLPIGIDYHSSAYRYCAGHQGEATHPPLRQEAQLLKILAEAPPTWARKPRIFVDFQHFDSMRLAPFHRAEQFHEDRTSIFNFLVATGLVDFDATRLRRSHLWKRKSEYAFSVSPHGNGLDCHRTWEDLALGCIVIVKTSPLDPLYEGLPVVIVQDWAEITEENLHKWLKTFGDASTHPEYRRRISMQYWLDQMRTCAAPYKRSQQ